MTNRKRKRTIASSRKKPERETLKSVQEGSKKDTNINNENEAWILNEFILLDDLRSNDAPACDSEECNLNTFCVYEGQILKALWKSCTDCQLNDDKNWPSIEECKDAADNMPFAKEMAGIVKKKCVLNSSTILPSHMSCVDSYATSAMKGKEKDKESQLEKNMIVEDSDLNSNDNIKSSTVSKSIANETPMENDVQEKGNKINLNCNVDSNSARTLANRKRT